MEEKEETNQTPESITKSPKSSTPSPQTEKCKVLWVKSNSFAVDFKGYGISLQKEPDLEINSDYVTIQYTSDICQSDFTYSMLVE